MVLEDGFNRHFASGFRGMGLALYVAATERNIDMPCLQIDPSVSRVDRFLFQRGNHLRVGIQILGSSFAFGVSLHA